jgi:hypothetical protein
MDDHRIIAMNVKDGFCGQNLLADTRLAIESSRESNETSRPPFYALRPDASHLLSPNG